jgi:microcystin-dependent protein
VADTITKNYSWVKPEVHGSPTTWGDKLNSNLDLIDAQVKSNQDAVASGGTLIGQIVMWSGLSPPANWWWCSGDAVKRSDYPDLFNVIGTRFGAGDGTTTFNLPSLFGRVPVGYDGGTWTMGATGGEVAHALAGNELAAHVHGVNDPGHVHGVGDPGHTHGISQSPHGHGVNDPGHAHAYTMWQASGPLAVNGVQTYTQGGVPATTGAVLSGISIQPQNANISINGAGTGIFIGGAATGISTQNAGSSTPHNNLQPYLVIGFIIRLL